jgi:hypothetical protein
MTHSPETPSVLAAVKRIEALTQEIRRDPLEPCPAVLRQDGGWSVER